MEKIQMIQLYNSDCIAGMATIPDGSIDLILTDPPYYSTNLHFDKEPRIDFNAWLKDCRRVLKPTGVLVSFADLNLLIELRGHKVFKSFYELIWHKTMAVGMYDANKRPLKAHEYACVFTNAFTDSTYIPQKTAGKPYRLQQSARLPSQYGSAKQTITDNPTGDRYPTSVVQFSNGHGGQSLHPTQKPLDLCQWLIKTYSNENDTVLDLFMGSGTTGAACVKTNRNFIGFELHKPYYDIAQKRINDAQHDLEVMFAFG